MITIFHGDNSTASRTACLEIINTAKSGSVFQTDSKNIDLNQLNNFLSSGSLFEDSKTLVVDNFFSIPKANLDKLVKLINQNQCDVIIWQDKALNVTQLKTFPQAKVQAFKADNQLFTCLNAIIPHNLNQFIKLQIRQLKVRVYFFFGNNVVIEKIVAKQIIFIYNEC